MNRRIIVTLGLAVVALIAFSLVDASEGRRDGPCYTLRESKLRGCFVCSVTFAPSLINWNGKQIAIKEAWIEERFDRGPFGFKRKTLSGYHLCLNLSQGSDVEHGFYFEARGVYFGQIGTVVEYARLETIDATEYTVLCRLGLETERSVRIKVTPDGSIKIRQ
ncbi:MAG: hypothetical protein EXR98_13380 [Gemmataceae bacterium]|nr:hypothetical protein [Gemmataceae bacterium]